MPNNLRVDWGIRESTGDSAAPTSGTWNTFDCVENNAPALGNPIQWICISGGTPGTWQADRPLQNTSQVASVTAAQNVSVTANLINVPNSVSTGFNLTLAAPVANNNGTELYVCNQGTGTITAVAATGTAINGLATVPPNHQSGTFRSIGTQWYRV